MNKFCVPFIIYYWQQVLFTWRVSSLLSPLNDAFIDFVNKEGSFQFSPEAELISFFSVFSWSWIDITRIRSTYTEEKSGASYNCYSVKIMLQDVVFKRLLNELLLKTEWSEVMLIWCFISIKFIRSFLKFYFLIFLFKQFPLQFQLNWRNCTFSIYRYHYDSTVLFFFCLMSQKSIIFVFSYAHF